MNESTTERRLERLQRFVELRAPQEVIDKELALIRTSLLTVPAQEQHRIWEALRELGL